MKVVTNKLTISFVLILALLATFLVACEPADAETVTLTLYIHEGSDTGPAVEGAQVIGQDGAGTSFSENTDSSGCVTITGASGTWSFTASSSGYDDKSWDQSISSTCEKHAYLSNDTSEAPPIPPVSTFAMDFDDFSSEAEGASTLVNEEQSVQFASLTFGDDEYPLNEYVLGEKGNWNWASWNVGVWSVLAVAGSAVPVAAFVKTVNNDVPQQQADYTWIWSNDFQVGLQTYTAELHGKYKEDENGVRWDMYISEQGKHENFLWYYGESNLPATEGFWVLSSKPAELTDDPIDWIRVDWARNLAEGTCSISYTNIVPDGPENGGYIAYEVTVPTEESPYDRHYEIYNKGADNLTDIEWDSITKEGRVKDPNHFGDDEWHRWDADYYNVEVSA